MSAAARFMTARCAAAPRVIIAPDDLAPGQLIAVHSYRDRIVPYITPYGGVRRVPQSPSEVYGMPGSPLRVDLIQFPFVTITRMLNGQIATHAIDTRLVRLMRIDDAYARSLAPGLLPPAASTPAPPHESAEAKPCS